MYKLCGGTLLVLLLNSRKAEIKETSILEAMLKLLNPNLFINKSTLKEQTKKFKICKEHSNLATPFEEEAMQNVMTECILSHYDELLVSMTKFIDDNIDTVSDTHKDEILVKAVLDVIEQDNSIPMDQEFYILPEGKSVTKERLISIQKVYLPSFILGVLYYVMMNIKDNKEGTETYEKWCPKPDSGTIRKYTANIGENSSRQVVLINTSDEYDYYELLDLAGEQITLYVKPIPTDDDYDIITTTVIVTDTIDDSEKEDYLKLKGSLYDIKKIKELITDCNELICCVNKYRNSANRDEVNKLSRTKFDFFHKWLFYPYKFEGSLIQKWGDFILSKIEQSETIDISNRTVTPTPIKLNITKVPVMKYKTQKFHCLNSTEENGTTNQRENNKTEKE